MPSSIHPGSKVQARVGPFCIESIGDKNGVPPSPQSSADKRTRRVRSIIYGWGVVSAGLSTSNNKKSWRVLWANCGKTCDHPAMPLKVVNDNVHGFEMSLFERLLSSDYYMTTKELLTVFDCI